MSTTLVIYNPICGDRKAKQLFDDHVIPLLQQNNKTIDKVLSTEHPGHAGSFVVEYLEAAEGPLTIVLGSGDGTLHEIIETLNNTPLKGLRASTPPTKISFALVPCGTANALYASLFPSSAQDDPAQYKLKSVQAFLGSPNTVPLTLAITTLSSAPHVRKPPQVAVSAVVASTALHASILHDSETLRASTPGIERFKVAAAQNITRWYHAYVKLFPTQSAGVVELFDPAAGRFVPHPQSAEDDDPIIDVGGPFAYFLSTVNVDRLESAFRISPRASEEPADGPALDVVVVRPFRDPSCLMDSEETRAAYASKVGAVMGAAYQDGAHTQLRYAADGSITTEGDGETVVEYYRCGGWEWEPDEIDERAHFLCADGDIHQIEKLGKATCTAAAPVDDKAGFAVFV
ncbi:ATP-NAD kinase-like domain-containing protein [Amylocystis lapponica]|nr:ATP-NAD kinase-like domain-containing protein [Amylocystis lapponica]